MFVDFGQKNKNIPNKHCPRNLDVIELSILYDTIEPTARMHHHPVHFGACKNAAHDDMISQLNPGF